MSVYPTTTLESLATFTNPDDNDALIDPDIITVVITKPDGDTETEDYSIPSTFPPIGITRVSLGVYKLLYDADQEGLYRFRWYGEKDDLKITGIATINMTPVDVEL